MQSIRSSEQLFGNMVAYAPNTSSGLFICAERQLAGLIFEHLFQNVWKILSYSLWKNWNEDRTGSISAGKMYHRLRQVLREYRGGGDRPQNSRCTRRMQNSLFTTSMAPSNSLRLVSFLKRLATTKRPRYLRWVCVKSVRHPTERNFLVTLHSLLHHYSSHKLLSKDTRDNVVFGLGSNLNHP